MVIPVKKMSLHEDILEQMLQAIKNGEFSSGEKLPREIDLAEQFQVSRNCVREAMKTLGWLGIVTSVSGHGTFVTKNAQNKIINTELLKDLTEKTSFLELMETRLFLEPAIAFMAALRATQDDVEELRLIMEKSTEDKDESNGIDIVSVSEFHEKLAGIAGNKIMIKLLNSIKSEMEAHRITYKDIPKSTWNVMLDCHRQILDHVASGSPEKAFEAMYKDLLQSLVVLDIPQEKPDHLLNLHEQMVSDSE